MMVYYNEIDPFCVEWLRNLIAAGELPEGHVDERDIGDIAPADIEGYDQCHFFAGIGGWPLALRIAGVPDDAPLWTGSCPCQPFSAAGKRKGADDERHLWPFWRWLIDQCRPAIVVGEQVASKAAREQWLAGVRADLEAMGYAVGAADLPAACVGAPHIRQRLWWVADAGHRPERVDRDVQEARRENERPPPRKGHGGERAAAHRGADGGVADADGRHTGSEGLQRGGEHGCEPQDGGVGRGVGDADLDFWSGVLIPCADGKARRIEPGIFPLAHGVPARVGKLRAAGNAIVPQVAAEFVEAFFDVPSVEICE